MYRCLSPNLAVSNLIILGASKLGSLGCSLGSLEPHHKPIKSESLEVDFLVQEICLSPRLRLVGKFQKSPVYFSVG